ncbi:MAG: hypothetical protein ABIC91_05355 [Nanoarchaeota archaeon]|nr:hypothetical protein [Nanoarchaeota archaeon]MBU1030236.1 hypothetical protein [Nanoarchaeota archaeon]
MVLKELLVFQGYTVDLRLKQFRKVTKDEMQFIDFDSKHGRKLIQEMNNHRLR